MVKLFQIFGLMLEYQIDGGVTVIDKMHRKAVSHSDAFL